MKAKHQRRRSLQAAALGAGMALSQIALAGGSGCSVARSGHCSACGGCVAALVGLGGWALWWARNRTPGSGRDA
ncbi:hypothetical protein [Thiolapillus brandeum]|uniref:hypothetical protein n=1 Tax=Thiolapillus brandeum TaxID=1076588 RepID=UPI000698A057|nr:hypothetical protein [Thiolapillus brandeum]